MAGWGTKLKDEVGVMAEKGPEEAEESEIGRAHV